MKHQDFKRLTSSIWQNNADDLNTTIISFQRNPVTWNKESFGNILHEMKRTKARLSRVQKALEFSRDSQLLKLESDLQSKLMQLLENEECLWKMKSRINLLSLDDRNTSFFHTSTLIRRRRNKIFSILKADQTWTFDFSEIGNEFRNNLINTLCTVQNHTNTLDQPLSDCNFPNILLDFHHNLSRIPEEDQIKSTLFELHPLKTPGDDGLNAYFYQQKLGPD